MGGLERRKSLEEKVGFGGCGDGANWSQIGGATEADQSGEKLSSLLSTNQRKERKGRHRMQGKAN